MKLFYSIFFVCVMATIAPRHAQSACEVIQTASGNEVICQGTPLTEEEKEAHTKEQAAVEELRKKDEEIKQAQQKIEGEKRILELDYTVNVTDLEVRLLDSRYGYNSYSFKFRAHNPGKAGKVWFNVVMYDRNGFETDSFLVQSYFGRGEAKILTETRMTKFNFERWQVEPTNKF